MSSTQVSKATPAGSTNPTSRRLWEFHGTEPRPPTWASATNGTVYSLQSALGAVIWNPKGLPQLTYGGTSEHSPPISGGMVSRVEKSTLTGWVLFNQNLMPSTRVAS